MISLLHVWLTLQVCVCSCVCSSSGCSVIQQEVDLWLPKEGGRTSHSTIILQEKSQAKAPISHPQILTSPFFQNLQLAVVVSKAVSFDAQHHSKLTPLTDLQVCCGAFNSYIPSYSMVWFVCPRLMADSVKMLLLCLHTEMQQLHLRNASKQFVIGIESRERHA